MMRNLTPSRYRGVSVTTVTFPLVESELRRHFMGREAYRRTRFIVVRNASEVALLQVSKQSDEPLFSPIVEVETLADPGDCSWVKDPEIDTGVPTQMARAARDYAPGSRCVVVEGRYGHVNFILEPSPITLRVVDIVPPYPAKLLDQVERVLAVAEHLPPVELQPEITDLADLAAGRPSPRYLFPCRGSGASVATAEVRYLDERPEREDWVLVGCRRSREIHEWFYGDVPASIEICPHELVTPSSIATLTKCCDIEYGVEIDGHQATVPWGASLEEVRVALESLLSTLGPAWAPA